MGAFTGSYSRDMVERACVLYQAGVNPPEIARELKMRRTSVYSLLKAGRTAFRKHGERPGHLSLREVLRRVGGTHHRIQEAIKEAGVVPLMVGTWPRIAEPDVQKIATCINADLVPEFRKVDPSQLAWLAGIVDGEGHVDIHYGRDERAAAGKTHRGTWEIANTDKEILDGVAEVLQLLGVQYRYRESRRRTSAGRRVWRVFVSRARDIAMVCHATLPHLRGKKKRASEIVLKWATEKLSLGHRRGGKFELAQKYVRLMQKEAV